MLTSIYRSFLFVISKKKRKEKKELKHIIKFYPVICAILNTVKQYKNTNKLYLKELDHGLLKFKSSVFQELRTIERKRE